MKYLKNKHVILPQIQLGKPKAGGTVYVFGTSQPSNNKVLVDILQWTSNGASGNQRGKLLIAQKFDDNRCY